MGTNLTNENEPENQQAKAALGSLAAGGSGLLASAWNSPTLTTWFSFLMKSSAAILVLPLLVTRLSESEYTVWEVFLSVIALQMLAQFGFTPSFVRAIGYVLAGKDKLGSESESESASAPGNRNSVAADVLRGVAIPDVCGTMEIIFRRLSLASFLVLSIGGFFAISGPISRLENPIHAWTAWACVCLVTPMVFYGLIYVAYLQGINEISLLRRWEGVFALMSVVSMSLVLLLGGGLFWLVVAHQSAALGSVLMNRYWCCKSVTPRFEVTNRQIDERVFGFVWPAAWRSGLGILMARGILNVSAIVLASMLPVTQAASLLLSLRIIQSITVFSQAPFYSKVPKLIRLYARNENRTMLRVAQNGMLLSHLTFSLAVSAVALLAPAGLGWIGSKTKFVPTNLWLLLALAFFVQRFGAMHIQLYSLTNRIIWHVANGVSGLLVVVSLAILIKPLGIYSLPLAWLIGHASFYVWYAARKSYQEFDLRFPRFEYSASLAGAIVLMLGSGVVYLVN